MRYRQRAARTTRSERRSRQSLSTLAARSSSRTGSRCATQCRLTRHTHSALQLHAKLRDHSSKQLTTSKGKVKVQGSNANVSHTINEDERREFTAHINGVLEGDADIGTRLPIPTDTMQIFDECRDGLILCKLINDSVPDTIDTRVLNKPTAKKPLNAFQITENNNIVITSARGIGCSVVNIGSTDIAEGTEHLILGLIWQIIRRGLLARVDIKIHPELYRLCEDGETIEDLLRLTPDQILLRWFNYHLKAAGWKRRVGNFSKDVRDGENYTVLLNQLKPDQCSLAPLQTSNLQQRAEQVRKCILCLGISNVFLGSAKRRTDRVPQVPHAALIVVRQPAP